jgi:GT2 family glycosyltransferase
MSIRKKLKVAVLVINYNGKHYLRECLESLKNQTYSNYDVYVVDNGSVDGSVEYVKGYFPWVKIIAFKENLGFAKAYNEAIKIVDADLIALLNNDTQVDRRWLQELVSAILEDELIAAVGSKILLYDNPQLLNHAGAKITPIGGGFDIGLYDEDCEKYNVKKYVGAACGAAMLVRKDFFLKIKGFDEDFFAYFEDVDFCWRAWLYGHKVIYNPSSVVYHKFSGSWGRKNPYKIFLGQRNKLMAIIKNFELRNMFIGLMILPIYDLFEVIDRGFLRKDIRLIKAKFMGYIETIRNLQQIVQKRTEVQSKRVLFDRNLKSQGYIACLKDCLVEYLKLRDNPKHY